MSRDDAFRMSLDYFRRCCEAFERRDRRAHTIAALAHGMCHAAMFGQLTAAAIADGGGDPHEKGWRPRTKRQ